MQPAVEPGDVEPASAGDIPASCLTLTPCAGPAATQAVNITSLEVAFIPGYNRLPANDFPRVAVSDSAGTVSMVWNDAGRNPLGDILLQSFNLGSLSAVQAQPVRLNSDSGIGTLHFLPALRNVIHDGSAGSSTVAPVN